MDERREGMTEFGVIQREHGERLARLEEGMTNLKESVNSGFMEIKEGIQGLTQTVNNTRLEVGVNKEKSKNWGAIITSLLAFGTAIGAFFKGNQ